MGKRRFAFSVLVHCDPASALVEFSTASSVLQVRLTAGLAQVSHSSRASLGSMLACKARGAQQVSSAVELSVQHSNPAGGLAQLGQFPACHLRPS